MDKGKIEAMVTKFSEKFAIIMLKKLRKFCWRCLTNLDATPTFQKLSKYILDALYVYLPHPKEPFTRLIKGLNQCVLRLIWPSKTGLIKMAYTFVKL